MGLVGCGAGAAVLPLLLWLLVFFPVACCALCLFFVVFCSVFDNIPFFFVLSL